MAGRVRRTRIVSANISAIFFDLDNTLIPTKRGDKLACEKICFTLREQYNMPHDLAHDSTKKFLHAFRKCPDNKESQCLDEWRRLLWVEALGNDYRHLAGPIYRLWLQLRFQFLALTPQVQRLLVSLKEMRFQLALITNGSSRSQWEKIQLLKVQPFFDLVLVSGDLPWEKPHANIFLQACSMLKVQPEAAIMIGDKLETDILGGQILAATVWIKPPEVVNSTVQANPDFTLSDVTHLSRVLQVAPAPPDFDDCNSNASNASDGS
ncbi:N-acylneuraminate-9-phosphatase [Neocloeon triangulifer]|uniref:N-acylneuraminate-9-phosphatase n=1 Tax=Neocloeon triangulifer TaxID=2078957 RepID=UPI00286F5DE7|nr:N-acylneuraminate-9-phosphatase [Neocloeon triangulifer]